MDKGLLNDKINQYLYKGHLTHKILYTRLGAWELTYEGAVKGGLIGLGYGASYGHDTDDLTHRITMSYFGGAEKSNVPLAIVEETGLAGLLFYCMLIGVVSYKILKLFISARRPEYRVLIGILAGIFFGFLVNSLFENWWGSAGSPESVYFFALIGVIRGLEIAKNRDTVHRISFSSNMLNMNVKIIEYNNNNYFHGALVF